MTTKKVGHKTWLTVVEVGLAVGLIYLLWGRVWTPEIWAVWSVLAAAIIILELRRR